MNDFMWCSPTKFIFKHGACELIGSELAALGVENILLVYGQGSVVRLGILDSVKASLERAGIQFAELSGVRPNPEVSLVREGIVLARSNNSQLVFAIGGGSAIDCAKAIAVGFSYDGDPWDFFVKKAAADPKKTLPVACVLTIPAAGSEASNSCVISNDAEGRKCGINGDHIRPKLAFMDPQLTYSLPAYQTAAGSTDMIAHICERWFSGVGAVSITDGIAAALVKSIIAAVPKALENPADADARADLMWASTLAHNGISGVGRNARFDSRAGGWASHGLEHELSALKPEITHGAGLAVIMPAWMRYVWKADPQRFVDFGVKVFDKTAPNEDEASLEAFVLNVIDTLQEHFISWGMPRYLDEFGLTREDVPALLETLEATKGSSFGCFKILTMDDARAIYESAFE